jgi:hypothetical protein
MNATSLPVSTVAAGVLYVIYIMFNMRFWSDEYVRLLCELLD